MENYKENQKVLGWVHKVYPILADDLKQEAEQIFPELCQSEDEKIRKWVINEIKIKHHNLDEENVDFVDKAISWLEKQKEPKYIEPKCISIKEMVEKYRYEDEYDKDGNFKGKPVNCMVRAYEQGIRDVLAMIKIQSAEWSEEDEKMLKNVIDSVYIALKEFEKNRDTVVCGQIEKEIEWLKSLKPHWKPSEEQMRALNIAIENFCEWHIVDEDAIKSLYNDLQKL